MAIDIPIQLGFDEEETEVFNGMTARERGGFNRLRDDNSRIVYVQALDLGQNLVGCGLNVAALSVLIILASTEYKIDEEKLKLFSSADFYRYFRHISDSMKKTLDETVNKNDVVLFMKGTPELPECGFSRAVVQIFQVQGVDFSKIKTFNVLKDNELRQGVKEYSQWPTVPQVYIKGEFVGGCDIMLNMHQSGELEELLLKQGLIAEESEKEE
ncbi:4575_t:CDS:2 [Funneliformis mosseae]|uniref:Monothiol glutaredoxin-5, mitochondrial n=1 Tax=Funneliformis mosseae TaxID=27381 RepID=A0A9N9A3P2_FUNMO|nr:4575_t:CDS:2 [Funneliformis mosseae]